MKKSLILFLFPFLLPLTIAGQYVYNEASTAIPSFGIIRQNNIVYYEDSEANFFAHIVSLNLAAPYSKVKIPKGWYIRDFRIVEGTAYFCGIDSISMTALLGHFSIGNLLAGNGTITFYYDNNKIKDLAILERIAVVKRDKNVSILTIGMCRSGFDPNIYGSDVAVYVEDYHNTGLCCQYKANDTLWDVTTTDNYFVLAGITSYKYKLTMRRAPIGAPANTIMGFMTQCINYTCTYKFASGLRAVGLGHDSTAIASYYDDQPYASMQLFTIDVPSGHMNINQRDGWGFINPGQLAPPADMAYLKDSNALMVIDTTASYKWAILRLNPYATAWMYETPFYYFRSTDLTYTSLYPFPPSTFMAASGGRWMKLELGSTSLPIPGTYTNCLESYTTDIFTYTGYCDSTEQSGAYEKYIISLTSQDDNVALSTLEMGCY